MFRTHDSNVLGVPGAAKFLTDTGSIRASQWYAEIEAWQRTSPRLLRAIIVIRRETRHLGPTEERKRRHRKHQDPCLDADEILICLRQRVTAANVDKGP
ncbi:hypothetical protein [Novipirellula rosea]|uniref:Uncharacterized protein n=1 Tax=Novipirellula rosea TaxID=1031540 RepID=A0ABP8MEI2_9BACT